MVKMVKNLRPFIFVIGVSPTLFYVNAIIQTSPPIISRSVRGGTQILFSWPNAYAQQTWWACFKTKKKRLGWVSCRIDVVGCNL